MNPLAWDGGTWITALGAVAGAMAWMTAMWIRAGRILQRLDDIAGRQVKHENKIDDHGKRLIRLETILEAEC